MKPGRELDALVAEKVMGWTCQQEYWESISFFSAPWAVEKSGRNEHCPNFGRSCSDHCPRYSTEIAAAWKVVEKLIHDRVLDSFQMTYTPSNGWFVEFGNVSHADQDVTSAPHAICLAALKCVGVEIE